MEGETKKHPECVGLILEEKEQRERERDPERTAGRTVLPLSEWPG